MKYNRHLHQGYHVSGTITFNQLRFAITKLNTQRPANRMHFAVRSWCHLVTCRCDCSDLTECFYGNPATIGNPGRRAVTLDFLTPLRFVINCSYTAVLLRKCIPVTPKDTARCCRDHFWGYLKGTKLLLCHHQYISRRVFLWANLDFGLLTKKGPGPGTLVY